MVEDSGTPVMRHCVHKCVCVLLQVRVLTNKGLLQLGDFTNKGLIQLRVLINEGSRALTNEGSYK